MLNELIAMFPSIHTDKRMDVRGGFVNVNLNLETIKMLNCNTDCHAY